MYINPGETQVASRNVKQLYAYHHPLALFSHVIASVGQSEGKEKSPKQLGKVHQPARYRELCL